MRRSDDTRHQFDRRKPEGKQTAGRVSSEDRDTVIEIDVEHGTEGDSRQLMTRSGTQFLATHGYKKNPDSAVGMSWI